MLRLNPHAAQRNTYKPALTQDISHRELLSAYARCIQKHNYTTYLCLLLPNVLISEQSPLSANFVLHNRLRVPQLGESAAWHMGERIMNGLALQILQLGNPIPDEIARGVAFLRLRDGVEDSLEVSVPPTKHRKDSRSMAAGLYRSERSALTVLE